MIPYECPRCRVFVAQGCRFLVAGRVQDGTFHMLNHIHYPTSARDMCMALNEQAFRFDLSSSTIRAQQG